MAHEIDNTDLVFHVLNVGFGDNIVVEFPAGNNDTRSYALVDCYDSQKTRTYLNKLIAVSGGSKRLRFVCATHPHRDHILGIKYFLETAAWRPYEFWDSGFRHNSKTYLDILTELRKQGIGTVRVSSGMERYYGAVQVTVLAPSVSLRNRYATYGVDMNNASIVLRFEHHGQDVLLNQSAEYSGSVSHEMLRQAGGSVVILAGDAEYDSWSEVTDEYPRLERTDENDPLVKKMINYLACSVVKVAHHGSMHSTPLDVYEKMSPELAVISTKQTVGTKDVGGFSVERGLFPHPSATSALEECKVRIVTTDGSYEQGRPVTGKHEGSIVIAVPPGGRPWWTKLDDAKEAVPDPPTHLLFPV